jgi:hypothetical protein
MEVIRSFDAPGSGDAAGGADGDKQDGDSDEEREEDGDVEEDDNGLGDGRDTAEQPPAPPL